MRTYTCVSIFIHPASTVTILRRYDRDFVVRITPSRFYILYTYEITVQNLADVLYYVVTTVNLWL